MTMDNVALPPPVMWAQRKTSVFLTFIVECKDPDIKFEKNSLFFKGLCDPGQVPHEVNIPLYADIVPDQCVILNKGRCIEVNIPKDNKNTSFWPALTNDKKKYHWLKVDFNKWQDEEDVEEDRGSTDLGNLEDYLSRMGSNGEQERPSFDVDTDSDDEEGLPDLE